MGGISSVYSVTRSVLSGSWVVEKQQSALSSQHFSPWNCLGALKTVKGRKVGAR